LAIHGDERETPVGVLQVSGLVAYPVEFKGQWVPDARVGAAIKGNL
jgi:hypothetical protein